MLHSCKKEVDLYADMEQALRDSGNNKVQMHVCVKKIYGHRYIRTDMCLCNLYKCM